MLAATQVHGETWSQQASDCTACVHVRPCQPLARQRSSYPGGGGASSLAGLQNAEGAILGPFDCWLALRGLTTMALRMERQASTAALLAQHLAQHPLVQRVSLSSPQKQGQAEAGQRCAGCWSSCKGPLSAWCAGGFPCATLPPSRNTPKS